MRPAIPPRARRVAVLESAFASVVAVDHVAHPKPAHDIYFESCRALGAAPADAIALEDSQTGVGSALVAGMFVIGVPSLEGVDLAEAHLQAASLESPVVWEVLGLRMAA